jgi:hypothetical protein
MRAMFSFAALLALAVPAFAGEKKDIIDTAASADGFKTLVAAVKAAGLVDTLKGDCPFTVLAPTDEAFAKLPAGTVEALLKPENKHKLCDRHRDHAPGQGLSPTGPARGSASDAARPDSSRVRAGRSRFPAFEPDRV